MRAGLRAGPFWVSTSGQRSRWKMPAGLVAVLFVLFMLAAFGVSTTILAGIAWALSVIWLAVAISRPVRRHRQRRAAVQPPSVPARPVSPRMYHSDRR